MRNVRRVFAGVRVQMVLVFGVMTTILAVMVASVSIYYLNTSIRRESVSRAVLRTEQIGLRARILVDEASKVLNWGASSDAYSFFIAEDDKHREAVRLIQDMSVYRASSLINDSIDNVYLFDVDGRSYDERKGVYMIDRYPKSRRIFEAVRGKPDSLIYLPAGDGEEAGFIVYGSAVGQHGRGPTIGYVAVAFSSRITGDFLNEELRGEGAQFALLDPEIGLITGSADFPADLLRDGEGWQSQDDVAYRVCRVDGHELLLTSNDIPNTNWRMLGMVSMDDMTRKLRQVVVVVAALSLAALAASIFAYQLIAGRMVRPISRMRERMLEVQGGNLDATVEEGSTNEFSLLEHQYNEMLARIKLLIEQNREDQKALQKAEFVALQAQIAPHFLYNTLDTIIWLVAVNENDKAMAMLDNLSVFFKTGLSKGMDWIHVSSEIDHVRSYLYIQQSRYSDMLTYDIRVDEEMYRYDMLKMLLQPIVENAIYHGIKNTASGGRIEITGQIDGRFLRFAVRDTGVGMDEAFVDRLNRRMRENRHPYEENENGFGLYNVNRRIRLYYGDACGLTVSSAPDEGTTVELRLLRMEGKQAEE